MTHPMCEMVVRGYTLSNSPFCFNRLQPIRRTSVLGVVPGATQEPASYLRQFHFCLTDRRRDFSDHKPHVHPSSNRKWIGRAL